MNAFTDYRMLETRRQFFTRGKNVLGYAALSKLLGDPCGAVAGAVGKLSAAGGKLPGGNPLGLPHFAPWTIGAIAGFGGP